MTKQEAKSLVNIFMLYLFYSMNEIINSIDEEKFEKMLVGEFFERFMEGLNTVVKFFENRGTNFKTDFINTLKSLAKEVE